MSHETEKPPTTEEPKGEVPPKQGTPKEEEKPSDWLSAGTSWGTSWLQSAKQKTFQTLEAVKKDLDEFKEVMATEVTGITTAAKEGLGTVGAQVKQQAQLLEKLVTPDEESKPVPEAKEATENETVEEEPKISQSNSMGFGWMKSIVETVKNLAVEDTTDGEAEITEEIRPKTLRRTNLPAAKLLGIQNDEATYIAAPEDQRVFEEWLKKFCMTEHDGEINMLLANAPALRQIYAKMVPSVVDNQTFWTRYFFKVELAEIDEEMKYTLKGLTINTEQKQKMREGEGKETNDSPSSDSTQRSEPAGGARSNDDWSMCSKDEHDIEELNSTDGGGDTEKEDEERKEKGEEAPLTPKPTEEGTKEGEKREDGWVDWDE